MNRRREATPKFLVVTCIIFGLCVILQSVQVLKTNLTIVKILNLISIIFLSSIIGAYIREIFLLKKRNN